MSSMSHRIVLAAVLVPALSTVALAQGAPGDCGDCYAAAPVVVPVAAPAPEVDLSRRLGVGLHVASLAIANHDDPDAEPTQLGGGGLQVRYKLTPRWELELGLSALRQHDDDGMPTGPILHSATLGALFHMRPGKRWDWYLVGAVGGLHEGEHDDANAEHQGRAMAQLGIGVDHRWGRLGVGLELRAVGIAPEEDDGRASATDAAARTAGTGGTTTTPPAVEDDRRGDHGAQVSLGATYYF
jgi:hypothetical protein